MVGGLKRWRTQGLEDSNGWRTPQVKGEHEWTTSGVGGLMGWRRFFSISSTYPQFSSNFSHFLLQIPNFPLIFLNFLCIPHFSSNFPHPQLNISHFPPAFLTPNCTFHVSPQLPTLPPKLFPFSLVSSLAQPWIRVTCRRGSHRRSCCTESGTCGSQGGAAGTATG